MSAPEKAYPFVLHKKCKGSLVLADRGLFFRPASPNGPRVVLPWHQIAKHQVSPASHPKCLLKVIERATDNPEDVPKWLADLREANSGGKGKAGGASYTFEFPERTSLEGARRAVSARLPKNGGGAAAKPAGKKRPRDEPSPSANGNTLQPLQHKRGSTPPSSHFVDLDPVALVATHSSILASDPALRAQHRLLVLDGITLSEEDFWETHHRLVANEYAKISGKTNRGMSSDIKSSLDLGLSTNAKKGAPKKDGKGAMGGIVHLGVEEMRQIFIMYPAVHRAYEEKVPLELSEEQFWRKYLESEYFHRDRGRIGAHIGKVNERELAEQERLFGKAKEAEEEDIGKDAKEKKKKEEDVKLGEEEAKNRLAAAGTDDIFSRYEGNPAHAHKHHRSHHGHHRKNRKLGTHLATGQFDLASTAEVERGERFLGRDLHPPPERDSAGARVIDKYNRHWAIVLHPTESTAGVDLGHVAAKSAREGALNGDGDDDAKVNGGCDKEMRRLVGFADADENDADFARGVGDDEDNELMELHLKNIDAYSGKFGKDDPSKGKGDDPKTVLLYARMCAQQMRVSTEPILRDSTAGKAKGFCHAPTLINPLPNPKVGRRLLEALTAKMMADSQTEADARKLAETLPDAFKEKLAAFFRRASELLRHFFSLRSVFNEDGDDNGGVGASDAQRERLTSIVQGMERVHGEMYELTRNLPTVESKMYKPVMEQLDWAFKLHREDGSKGKGGFVTVAKGGFAPVAF